MQMVYSSQDSLAWGAIGSIGICTEPILFIQASTSMACFCKQGANFHNLPSSHGSMGISTSNVSSIISEQNSWLRLVNDSADVPIDALCCNFQQLNVSTVTAADAMLGKTTFNISCSAWVETKANLTNFSLFSARALQQINKLVSTYIPSCSCSAFDFSSLPSIAASETAVASPALVIGFGCVAGGLLVILLGVALKSMRKKQVSDSLPSNEFIIELANEPIYHPVPDGKKYHYCISYSGLHTHLGEYPFFTMSALHDVLTCLGFVGHFSVDSYMIEPPEETIERIQQACAVIVFVNDEIFQHRPCLFEWKAAETHSVPVICLGDSKNFEMQSLKQSMLKTNKYLAQSFWLSYIGKFRHQAQKMLIDKLSSHCKLAGSLTYRPRAAMPQGKKYHYFVSHKKRHSQLGLQPESLAMAFHDVLQASGFQGFFDLDNLKEITINEIKREVAASCTVIVLLHDETTTSEWCRLEWEVAAACSIPVLCIADQKHFQKQVLLDQVCEVNPHLLTIPWLDYLDEWRHVTQQSAIEWLKQEIQRSETGVIRHVQSLQQIHSTKSTDQMTVVSKASTTSKASTMHIQSLQSVLPSVSGGNIGSKMSTVNASRASNSIVKLQSLQSVLPGVPDVEECPSD